MIRVVHSWSGSWFFYPSRIPDPGVKKAPDPEFRGQKGTGSRIRNTDFHLISTVITCLQEAIKQGPGLVRAVLGQFRLFPPPEGGGAEVGDYLARQRLVADSQPRARLPHHPRERPQQVHHRLGSQLAQAEGSPRRVAVQIAWPQHVVEDHMLLRQGGVLQHVHITAWNVTLMLCGIYSFTGTQAWFFFYFLAETETLWSQGPVTRDFW